MKYPLAAPRNDAKIIAAMLREVSAQLSRIETILLTKPRAEGELGHRIRYEQAGIYLAEAQRTAAAIEMLARKIA